MERLHTISQSSSYCEKFKISPAIYDVRYVPLPESKAQDYSGGESQSPANITI
jgi:hypothetical protein